MSTLQSDALVWSKDGVSPFVAPRPFRHLSAFRDRFARELVSYFRDRGIDRDPDVEVMWLNLAITTTEAMTTFLYAHPGEQAKLKVTRRGLRVEPRAKRMLRRIHAGLVKRQVPYRWPGCLGSEDVLTFSASPLISEHAKDTQKRLVIGKFPDWFTAGPVPAEGAEYKLNQKRADDVVSLLDKTAREFDVVLSTESLKAFGEMISAYASYARYYLREAEAHQKRLPRELWIGSAGILYYRVLARAVAKRGGRTVGHDHGTGSGWLQTHDQLLSEFNYVHEFCTFTPAMARGLEANIDSRFLAHDRFVTSVTYPSRAAGISKIPTQYHEETSLRSDADLHAQATKRVMFVATTMRGRHCDYPVLLPDIPEADFQVRLFSNLTANGMSVLIRQHPESLYPIPATVAAVSGATFADGPFSQALTQADLVIFDCPMSTAFVESVSQGKAIVLIDFGFERRIQEADSLLRQRVAVVKAWCDVDGRAHLNWDELRDAIDVAPSLAGHRGFYQTYFG